MEAFAQYNEEDYFAEDWKELVNIYEEAIDYILNYEGGVPTIDYVIECAIEDMAEIITKAEDIELAEYEKVRKIRDLEAYVANLIANGNLSEQQISYVNEAMARGIELINAAEGTKAVADAYAQVIALIAQLIGR